MCGIFSVIRLLKEWDHQEITRLYQDFMNMKHRGPDHSSFQVLPHLVVGFHRLAIVDPTMRSNQPFIYEDNDRTVIFLCNGEIYNYKEIIHARGLSQLHSDCAVIPEAYLQMVRKDPHRVTYALDVFFQREVKGEFAFVLIELDKFKRLRHVIVGRDAVGIRPLYFHANDTNPQELYFTSELKGAHQSIHAFREFPPGHLHVYHVPVFGSMKLEAFEYSTFYRARPAVWTTANKPIWDEYEPSDAEHLYSVRKAVTESVRRRLNADQPMAWLLSGGVDSSLVAAVSTHLLGKPIRTFCCGMKGGTDLAYARQVADHIGSEHTEVLFTAEEALAAIPDVIRTIESWDTTTVRASVGQYLVSKHIGTHTDCKVVLVGEGPDEVCSSYLFNWYAPNSKALDACAREYVRNIHYYDVKRADRCIARWGLEGRVPLLDPEFIESYWVIPEEERHPKTHGLEKWWLRTAFAETGLLPDSVLYRKKEAFSDGISGQGTAPTENGHGGNEVLPSWFQIIQAWVEDKVTNEELANAHVTYPYCSPTTKEAYYYRRLFCELVGENRQTVIPGYWQPKWSADGQEIVNYVDPSARTLEVYTE